MKKNIRMHVLSPWQSALNAACLPHLFSVKTIGVVNKYKELPHSVCLSLCGTVLIMGCCM